MDDIERRYEKISKFSLKSLGLWPTQSKLKRYTGFTIFTFLVLKIVYPQIVNVLKHSDNTIITLETAVYVLFNVISLSKYVKALMLSIYEVRKNLTDHHEIKLMKKYENEAYFLVRFYALYVLTGILLHSLVPFAPPLLDAIYPLKNGTRGRLLPYRGDFVWFKQDDYHYEICVDFIVSAVIFWLLYAGIESIYTSTIKQICGLFAVVCYRFERKRKISSNVDQLSKQNFEEDYGLTSEEIADAVKLYNECIKCVGFLEDTYSIPVLVTQISLLLDMSIICLYVLFINEELLNGLRFGFFGSGMVLHLWYYFWIGQLVIDSSSRVHFSVYSSYWFSTSVKSQRLIVMACTRTLYPCFITSGKLSHLCLESFGAVLKTSMSLISVLLAVI
ncbi:hypothetical protein TKK_0004143 [Trichogramma kaykai]